MSSEITTVGGGLSGQDQAALDGITARVRDRLRRSAGDILAIGEDLMDAKELLGHGGFGAWLDAEFSLSRRSAEQFMAAFRRFGGNEVVASLPAGAVLELSAPSVSDELVEQVLSGKVKASVSSIREARTGQRSEERAVRAAESFLDAVERLRPTRNDYAAAIAARVLRGWWDPEQRAWFARAMAEAAELIEVNIDREIPTFEMARTTVRKLRE